jgi:hypothetical protein
VQNWKPNISHIFSLDAVWSDRIMKMNIKLLSEFMRDFNQVSDPRQITKVQVGIYLWKTCIPQGEREVLYMEDQFLYYHYTMFIGSIIFAFFTTYEELIERLIEAKPIGYAPPITATGHENRS